MKAHNEAESWQTKRQILSLFANDFSRTELQELIPGLSKWRIDQARQHAVVTGKGQPVLEKPVFRTRIDMAKVDHFLDFISRPDMIQDVAFGTKTMKLDSGERIIIPAVIKTVIPSRINEQYTSYCKHQDFEPASERSLFRMLEVCSASMQKSLQGLDNLTAEGTEAFETMSGVVKSLQQHGADRQWVEAALKALKEAKRYLKTDFKAHISRDEDCIDHCTVHALSNPTSNSADLRGECGHDHSVQCERCESLEKVLTEILQELEDADISADESARAMFDYTQSAQRIHTWKAHLLGAMKQEEAKQHALSQLDDKTCLIIMDWAMKFLPQHYREQMKEFFGKRGRSWHISAVITKAEKVEVECFVHIFNTCIQNSYTVASMVEHLLGTLKQEQPQISQAFLRSDNAGCYKNGPLLTAIPGISQRTGISVLRYDFSETQTGKDICDRKAAAMKAHIKRWVNEKHDVLTAEDMKEALESHRGTKGCRVAVVQVDSSKATGGDNKIPGISELNNFCFQETTGIRAWKAYDIGPGRLFSWDKLQASVQGDTGLTVLQPFGIRTKERGSVGGSVRPRYDIFAGQESGCVLTFMTQAEAEVHMDTGKHVRELESESLYDKIRKRWASRVTGVSPAETNQQPAASASFSRDQTSSSSAAQELARSYRPRPTGWALKTAKKPSRMSDNAKAFLVAKFETGARTGLKADPVHVNREIKFVRDATGKLLFQPEEWRTEQQVTQLFSRLSAAQKQSINEEDVNEDDIAAVEGEVVLAGMRDAVVRQVTFPNHPVQVGSRILCNLYRGNKLSTLKLVELQRICEELGLDFQGTLSRKKTFIAPIVTFLENCQCRQKL